MNRWLIVSLALNVLMILGLSALVWRLGGVGYVRYWLNNRGIAPIYEHRKDQFAMLPDATMKKLLMVGDSQTAYGEWAEWLGRDDVINRGIPGDGVEGVLRRLPDIVRQKPHTVCLMVGVNDLLFHDVDWVTARYKILVDTIMAQMPDTRLVLQTVPPVNNHVRQTGIKNTDIAALNSNICQIADAKGLACVDLFSAMADNNGELPAHITSDGLHLNGKGYTVWASLLGKTLLIGNP